MTAKVYQAIAAVTAALAKEGIGKDRKNTQQGYSFRGIDDVYNAVAPHLAETGLCILPNVESRECHERRSQAGGALFDVVCRVRFDFVAAEDGSTHTVTTYGEAMDSADKATNKAMSAAYKYACMQAFCIPTEGDNDADATSHAVAPRNTAAAPAAAPRAPAKHQTVKAAAAAPSDATFKFGKLKGAPLSDGSDRDLDWYEGAIAKSVNDPDKVKFRASNEAELRAIRAERARRIPGTKDYFDEDTGEIVTDDVNAAEAERRARVSAAMGTDDLPL